MANERIPNDPYRSGLSDDNFDRPQRLDSDLQVDPELQKGPASTSKITLFAVALALVLGAVFYGLNNTSVKEAQSEPPAQTAQTQNSAPQGAPGGMRDVTPKTNTRANTEPNTTTGSATSRPTPPQSAPKGAEIDRSANPPANKNDNK
jgi:hypothetical protein